MDNARRYQTPQYLDEPYRLIIFTLDEILAAIFTIYFLGTVAGFIVSSLIVASLLIYWLKRFKGNDSPVVYLQWLYWFFSLSPTLRATPPSWMREFLG